jgi:predicted permease
MSERLAAFAVGAGGALAVSLPATLLAQIVDALRDDDLPAAVTVPLAVVVMAGAVLGGWLVGRRRPRGQALVAAGAGALALGLVTVLGVARREAVGSDTDAWAVPAFMVWGALLASLGSAAGGRAAARTRP